MKQDEIGIIHKIKYFDCYIKIRKSTKYVLYPYTFSIEYKGVEYYF